MNPKVILLLSLLPFAVPFIISIGGSSALFRSALELIQGFRSSLPLVQRFSLAL